MIFEPRFCISRLSAAVRKLRKADLSDFIWGWGGKCPKKKCGCKKKPDFWFLGRTFHHFSDPGRELNAGANSQIPLVSSCLQMFFIILRQTCWFMQHHATFPKRIQLNLSGNFPATGIKMTSFLGNSAPWRHGQATFGLHQLNGEGLPRCGASVERGAAEPGLKNKDLCHLA